MNTLADGAEGADAEADDPESVLVTEEEQAESVPQEQFDRLAVWIKDILGERVTEVRDRAAQTLGRFVVEDVERRLEGAGGGEGDAGGDCDASRLQGDERPLSGGSDAAERAAGERLLQRRTVPGVERADRRDDLPPCPVERCDEPADDEPAADARDVLSTRVLPAPRGRVYRAFADVEEFEDELARAFPHLRRMRVTASETAGYAAGHPAADRARPDGGADARTLAPVDDVDPSRRQRGRHA